MAATLVPPDASDLAEVRARNEAVWARYMDAYTARRFADALDEWDPDGRMVYAEPVTGMPPAVVGRLNLYATWQSFGAAVLEMRHDEVSFHQTDDPSVAMVEYRLRIRLRRGGLHENRHLVRVRFEGGRIAEVVDRYEARAQARLVEAVRASARLV